MAATITPAWDQHLFRVELSVDVIEKKLGI